MCEITLHNFLCLDHPLILLKNHAQQQLLEVIGPWFWNKLALPETPHANSLRAHQKKCRIKTTRSHFRPSHASGSKWSRWTDVVQILRFPASKKTRLDVLGWSELNEYSIRCQYQIIWSLCYVCSHMHSWIKRVEETQGFGSKRQAPTRYHVFLAFPG